MIYVALLSMTSLESEFDSRSRGDFTECDCGGASNDRVDGWFSRSLDGPSKPSSFVIPFISST